MQFQTPLISGHLIKRYKRFLADIQLDNGEIVTAHCANPGSMLGMKDEGTRVWLEPNDDPKKKLKYSWKLNEYDDGTFCVVDTSLANKLVKEALTEKRLPPFSEFDSFKPEVKFGEKSRVDFWLNDPKLGELYLEVKSVTLSRQKGLAEFPDSVTERGAKHLRELMSILDQGHQAALLFVVNRNDCSAVDVARDVDGVYAGLFDQARAKGVEIYAYCAEISPQAVTLSRSINVIS